MSTPRRRPSAETLQALKAIDTPTITNVVATYPDHHLCLGLYNPWRENWYTDNTIRCVYPGMGAVVGFATTCVFGPPDPSFAGKLTFLDVVDALETRGGPGIVALQQKWPAETLSKVGLAGELMITAMKAMGCVGLVSNGPSRDVDAIEKLDFQMLLGGVSAGHGDLAVYSVDAPVSIGQMDVAPGEIIHMDANGAVKFPAEHADAVLANARALLKEEEGILAGLKRARTAGDIRRTFGENVYAEAAESAN